MLIDLPDDVIVLDGFYAEPIKVRQIALSVEYQSFGYEQNFPGKESVKSYYSFEHIKKFELLVGSHIYVEPNKYIFGKFRSSLRENRSRTTVHIDHGVNWTGIVYLSLDKDCQGGLGIYAHKETGLVKFPASIEELKTFSCSSVEEFDQIHTTKTRYKNNFSFGK